MKKLFCLLIIILVCACLPVSFALTVYDDGFITEGEYAYGVRWFSYDPPLIVAGGGADAIEVRDYGRLEVQYTSTPLQWNVGGIWDILLDGYSELLYTGGLTGEILIYDNSTATLKGGRIDAITSRQFVNDEEHIDLYCQPGWSWFYESSEIAGITGLWENNTSFTIDFIDDVDYDPVWMNINIIEIPEPATIALLLTGAFFIKRRR